MHASSSSSSYSRRHKCSATFSPPPSLLFSRTKAESTRRKEERGKRGMFITPQCGRTNRPPSPFPAIPPPLRAPPPPLFPAASLASHSQSHSSPPPVFPHFHFFFLSPLESGRGLRLSLSSFPRLLLQGSVRPSVRGGGGDGLGGGGREEKGARARPSSSHCGHSLLSLLPERPQGGYLGKVGGRIILLQYTKCCVCVCLPRRRRG